MLKPHKFTNPSKSVLSLSANLLKRVRKYGAVSFESLRRTGLKDRHSEDHIIAAIELLYLLDLIEYHPKSDTVEYVGKK